MRTKLINSIRKNKYLWYSFGIPFIILILLFFIQRIMPFGTDSATLYDSCHQYVPFLTEYHNKLLSGETLQFSMSTGLGQDFWLIWSYYLSSPFNLLLLFFKNEDVIVGMNIITIIKIAMTSFTATYYLKKKHNKIDVSTMAFGFCYGMSSYVMAYFCNIMWLDVIIMFPIVMLYFEKMMKDEKYADLKYVIALSYCLITNFYLSIPVCLFLVLYFFINVKADIKSLIRKGLKFAWTSLLSAGISGIVLIPNAYFFIKNASSSSKEGATFKVLENFFTFLSRHLYLTETQVDMSFKPGANLYCGTAIILLVFLYIFNKQIKLSEKIKKIILIVFLILSMNIEVLNFIWHGFDYPTGYVNRFSFIYIFILISIAYQCLLQIKNFTKLQVLVAGIVNGLFITYSYIYDKLNDKITEEKLMSYIVTSIVIAIYFIVIMLYKLKKIKKKSFSVVFSKLMILELCFYMIFAFTSYSYADTTNLYKYEDSYRKLNRSINKDGFYRSDIDYRKTSNECVYYNLNGVSYFSSTINSKFASVINKLGHRAGTNFYGIKGNNALTQLLFNIKYLYNESNYYTNFETIDSSDSIYLYKNNYETSYGYVFDKKFEKFYYDTNSNPFSLQNNLVEHATNGSIFYIYEPIRSENIKVASAGENFSRGSYTYNEDVTNDYICKIKYEKNKDIIYELNLKYICQNENDIVINIDPSNTYACNIKVNGSIYYSDYKISNEMVTVGGLKEGDELIVNIKIEKKATEGTIKCYFAEYNASQFDKFYKYITKNPVNITEFEDGHIKLNTTVDYEKTLFLSIPYNEGWSATDNGEPIEILKDNYFILIPLEKGEHNIELRYSTPFLGVGFIISGMSLMALYAIYKYKKNFEKIKKEQLTVIRKETTAELTGLDGSPSDESTDKN